MSRPGKVTSDSGESGSARQAADSIRYLVAQAQTGDPEAFDRLVECSRAGAVRYALALLGRANRNGGGMDNPLREAAQDVVQAALVEAWRDLPTLREPGAFAAWLRRLVFKQCDRLHRRSRAAQQPIRAGEQPAGYEAPDPAPEPGAALSAADQARWERVVIRLALASLPPGERAAVLLFYLGGCSHRDVAEYLQISLTAVKSRLHSARRRLRQRMENEMTEERVGQTGTIVGGPQQQQYEGSDLSDAERAQVLGGIEACYARYMDAYETLNLEETMTILAEDYELIFPADFGEPTWDKARVEQSVRKADGPRPRGPLRMRAVIEELLSTERDTAAGVVARATVRTTFVKEGHADNSPIPRIDTFVSTEQGWKMQRTVSLFRSEK